MAERAGVLEEAKGWQPTERGRPQGGVIRPLLANVYLNPLDHQRAQAGKAMVRYAEDFVILCRSEAEAQMALAAVSAWVNEAGLTVRGWYGYFPAQPGQRVPDGGWLGAAPVAQLAAMAQRWAWARKGDGPSPLAE